jgi:hypothetical protein
VFFQLEVVPRLEVRQAHRPSAALQCVVCHLRGFHVGPTVLDKFPLANRRRRDEAVESLRARDKLILHFLGEATAIRLDCGAVPFWRNLVAVCLVFRVVEMAAQKLKTLMTMALLDIYPFLTMTLDQKTKKLTQYFDGTKN